MLAIIFRRRIALAQVARAGKVAFGNSSAYRHIVAT
jgi:hypothetical protein